MSSQSQEEEWGDLAGDSRVWRLGEGDRVVPEPTRDELEEENAGHGSLPGADAWANQYLTLPGKGEQPGRCGQWVVGQACCTCGETVGQKRICRTRLCPECWSTWQHDGAERMTVRLAAARLAAGDGLDRRLIHAHVSVPADDVQSLEDYRNLPKQAAEYAEICGVRGAVAVPHPWRLTGDAKDAFRASDYRSQWRYVRESTDGDGWRELVKWSPHVHIIGLSRDFTAGADLDWEEIRRPTELEELNGVGERTADTLRAWGYESVSDLEDVPDEELLEVPGVGPATVKTARTALSADYSGAPDRFDGWTAGRISTFTPLNGPRDRDGFEHMYRTSAYLLSHTGFDPEESSQVVRWYGDLAGATFSGTDELSPADAHSVEWTAMKVRELRETFHRDAESEEERTEPDTCPCDDCDGDLLEIWLIDTYDQRLEEQVIETRGPRQWDRLVTAKKWMLGELQAPAGLARPSSEEQLHELLNHLSKAA